MSKSDPKGESKSSSSIEEENIIHNPERLINLTAWSGTLSWIFYATGAALIIADLFFLVQSIPNIRSDDVFAIIFSLAIFAFGLICVFFGLFSRIVSEGVLLVMDIEDNTRGK